MVLNRRTVLKSAMWSLPVIAVAVATPLASASEVPTQRIPLTCTQLNKGGTEWWLVAYNDDTTAMLSNGEMHRDKQLRELCK